MEIQGDANTQYMERAEELLIMAHVQVDYYMVCTQLSSLFYRDEFMAVAWPCQCVCVCNLEIFGLFRNIEILKSLITFNAYGLRALKSSKVFWYDFLSHQCFECPFLKCAGG